MLANVDYKVNSGPWREPCYFLTRNVLVTAQRNEDWIEVLGLAPPVLDDGDVVWGVVDGEISRCFRQMSLRVHPDKNPSPQAGVAFRGASMSRRRDGA